MEQLQFRKEIRKISTLVVKVGSRILTADNNVPDAERVRGLVDAIVHLQQSGIRTLLVSSGAIAQGMLASEIHPAKTGVRKHRANPAHEHVRIVFFPAQCSYRSSASHLG
jgi:glutamate 5-kinase